jgi:hypothetical protein
MKKFGHFICSIFILFYCLTCYQNANASTIESVSCSQSHVQEAINEAVSGDTVMIPKGSCTWSGTVKLSKRIILKGAGSSSTHITRTSNVAIDMGYTASRVTGIEFVFGATSENSIASIYVSGKGWRIDNCKFTNIKVGRSTAIMAQSGTAEKNAAGVIDNCDFLNSRVLAGGVLNVNQQHKIFYENANLGNGDSVYIEDCNLVKTQLGNVVDSGRGGKYVFRFNTYQNGDVQAHALQPDGHNRGTRSWEIYHNKAIGTSVSFFRRPIFLRAGEGVIFNNVISGSWGSNSLDLDSRREVSIQPEPDACNGKSIRDTNIDVMTGWLCRDQPGAGKDITLTESTGVSGSYNTKWGKQTQSPIYAWGNSLPLAPNATSGKHIKANRDYFDGAKWAVQTSKTSPFNGTVGTGQGPMAMMPASCTAGVGYWASDAGGNWNKSNSLANDGALYKCTSPNKWALFYIPYEYPHPLRSGNVAPPPVPQDGILAPKNIKIIQ